MLKRAGLPVTLKMRHDAHYVESLTSYSGGSGGTDDSLWIKSAPIRTSLVSRWEICAGELFGVHPRERRARAAAGAVCPARGLLFTSFPANGATMLRVRLGCVKCLASRKWRMTRRHWKLRRD